MSSLPGCWSQGETEEEALQNIRDAITEYLEVAERLRSEQDKEFKELLQ